MKIICHVIQISTDFPKQNKNKSAIPYGDILLVI